MTYDEKILAIIENPDSLGISPCAPALAMFLRQFRPVTPPHNKGFYLTSAEIQAQLEEIADFTLKEITQVMLYLGYQLYVDHAASPQWAMQPVQQSSNLIQ